MRVDFATPFATPPHITLAPWSLKGVCIWSVAADHFEWLAEADGVEIDWIAVGAEATPSP